MMPVVSLVQALSRLDPTRFSVRNDADDLEVVAHGASLDDPALPTGASPAVDALRAVLEEALATGCARVELAVQDRVTTSARWRGSLASPPTVTEVDAFAALPSVRVRLREPFGLSVVREALRRQTPELDALRRAMVSPRVPVEGLLPLVRPLATAALVSVRPPLRGALELMPPGTPPTLVRCLAGFAWEEEALWGELEHRPPVRVWLDAPWPSDLEGLSSLRAAPLEAEWLALSKDARARFDDMLFRNRWEGRNADAGGEAQWSTLRHALQELVASAVLREGRVRLQRAPRVAGRGAFRGGASDDAGDVKPLLGTYLFEQRGFPERREAVYNHHITLAALAEVAAATTEPLRCVDLGASDDGPRDDKLIRAHLSSPAVAALMSSLMSNAGAAHQHHQDAVLAWRGRATVAATLPLRRGREVTAVGTFVVGVVHGEGARPVAVTVERSGVMTAPREYGPPLDAGGRGSLRVLVRVGDGVTLGDVEAAALALRLLASRLVDDPPTRRALAGSPDAASAAPLRTHLAGVAFALSPASVLDLGNPDDSADEPGESAWVEARPESPLAHYHMASFCTWISFHFQDASRSAQPAVDALFRVALATLRAEGVAGSADVDEGSPWALLARDGRAARVVSLGDWGFDGWAVARVDDDASVGWAALLARSIARFVEGTMRASNAWEALWWHRWLCLGAVARQAAEPQVEATLARVEAEDFVRVLDARNGLRQTSLSALASTREAARGWWWRELTPGEKWGEAEGVFLREGALTDKVLRALDERLGVRLSKGVIEPAARGVGPAEWRIDDDNLPAMLALAASPDLDVLSKGLREDLRRRLCHLPKERYDLRVVGRAARVWPTVGGAYVCADDYPPGEAPGVELRGRRYAARLLGHEPFVLLEASERRYYDERVNPATREEELEARVHLENVSEVELLNGLFQPRRPVAHDHDFAVDD